MNHTVNDLRAALFRQLDALQDTGNDVAVEISRAKAMSDISRTILESARVELEQSRMTGGNGSGFLGEALPPSLEAPTSAGVDHARRTATGVAVTAGNRTIHKLR